MLQLLMDYTFAKYALITGLAVGIVCPLIGLFIVARRLSVIGEVISHMSLSGIAVGSIIGSAVGMFTPNLFGLLFAVIGALMMEWLRKSYIHFSELAVPIMLSFGIGLAVLLFSASNGFNVDFASYLFGNLLAVSDLDVWLTLAISTVIIVAFLLFYKELLAVTFDEEHAKISGIRAGHVQWIFIILVALTISISVQAVGVMLVSGMMVIPVAGGMMLAQGFAKTLTFSIVISECSIILGLLLSYYFDLASGGAIILVSLGLLFAIMFFKR